jgi:hypothetical protein
MEASGMLTYKDITIFHSIVKAELLLFYPKEMEVAISLSKNSLIADIPHFDSFLTRKTGQGKTPETVFLKQLLSYFRFPLISQRLENQHITAYAELDFPSEDDSTYWAGSYQGQLAFLATIAFLQDYGFHISLTGVDKHGAQYQMSRKGIMVLTSR